MVTFFLILFTLVISVINGIVTGKNWYVAKFSGGIPYFMNWCGAIMTAIGFSMIWAIVVGFVAGAFHLVSAQTLHAFSVFYPALIIVPLVLTGFVITIQSWAEVFRRGQGNMERFFNVAGASYNTYATIENTRSMFSIFGKVGNVFDGDDDLNETAIKAGILMSLFAVFGGIITAYLIISKTAKSTLIDMTQTRTA